MIYFLAYRDIHIHFVIQELMHIKKEDYRRLTKLNADGIRGDGNVVIRIEARRFIAKEFERRDFEDLNEHVRMGLLFTLGKKYIGVPYDPIWTIQIP